MPKYVQGDLFENVHEEGVLTIVPHVCNDMGAWGAGFVVPLGRAFPLAKQTYVGTSGHTLASTQFVQCGDVIVANMIAQHDVRPGRSPAGDLVPPIRYFALRQCMEAVGDFAAERVAAGERVRILCPLFGAGLAGGDWGTIESYIAAEWSALDVTVFYLPGTLPECVSSRDPETK